MTHRVDTERLEDAITSVCRHMSARGLTLTRTKLVKLLYFVDLEAWQELGHPVTGVEWVWHHYGPFSSEILHACSRMGSSEEIKVVAGHNPFGAREYRIYSESPAYFSVPASELETIVRRVIKSVGRLASTRIGDLSYETEPMRKLIRQGGSRGDLIEFPAPRPTSQAFTATVNRYRDILKLQQGDIGDIAEALRDEAEHFDEARRSAGSKVIG